MELLRQQTETEKTNLGSELEATYSKLYEKLDDEIKLQNQLVDEKRRVEVATTSLEQSERTISDCTIGDNI